MRMLKRRNFVIHTPEEIVRIREAARVTALAREEIAALASQQGFEDPSVFVQQYGRETIDDYLYSIKVDDYLNELAGIPAE